MTKRMLIDATHAEETRVVVLDGNRLEDFDVETSTKRQLKGNIYLAKVVRVEPSLQAAFVEYGGNRHGFLAFSEIHPDYYQIPVADRQRLLEMQAEDARREDEEDDLELALTQAVESPAEHSGPPPGVEQVGTTGNVVPEAWAAAETPRLIASEPAGVPEPAGLSESYADLAPAAEDWALPQLPALTAVGAAQALAVHVDTVVADEDSDEDEPFDMNGESIEMLPPPETLGGNDGDSGDDPRERRIPPRFLRNYKIQEVVRRRQIMLVQVVKEERGTKGAALTTYLSLAGRFGVLMPNSPRGGGISRKITSAADRRRLREVIEELEIPRGMGLIVRTAGANRPKPEIKRDCEYLLRLWDDIREHTMKSVAPAAIYEEASLIKRAIRDVYSRDIDEILVDGEDGWRAAHDFMRMLMPAHAKKVQLWRDTSSPGGQPLFARNQVEAQLDGMLMPIVQLRSGGYLVINQAEALVAIDVNSGRSTRERNIEETALRTNLEAADEVARQLRLRDLAGLIVIDFIDMESKRHNAMVERRLKEALKNDRARIQVGHISHFGLLEMSRQRLRPSLAETSFIACPHCGGTGHVRSTESSAIHVLRGIEDEGAKRRSAEIVVHVSTPVALYLLNHKRERLREIELRYTMRVIVAADDSQIAPQFRIEKVRTRSPDEIPPAVTQDRPVASSLVSEPEDDEDADIAGLDEDDDESEDESQDEAKAPEEMSAEENERRRKRRRRRRRGGRRDEPANDTGAADDAGAAAGAAIVDNQAEAAGHSPQPAPAGKQTVTEAEAGLTEEVTEASEPAGTAEEEARARRRGRRGGRRRRREGDGELSPFAVPGADQPELMPVYAGPTPADPFGGQDFDIFDVMDRAERAAEAQPPGRAPTAAEIVNRAAPEPAAAEVASAPEEIVTAGPETSAGTAHNAPPETVVAEPRVEIHPTEPPAAATVEAESPEDIPVVAGVASPRFVETAHAEAVTPGNGAVQAGAAEPSAVEPAGAEAVPALPEAPLAEPAIKPILIGAGAEPPVEKKRGWWRR